MQGARRRAQGLAVVDGLLFSQFLTLLPPPCSIPTRISFRRRSPPGSGSDGSDGKRKSHQLHPSPDAVLL